MPYVETVMLTVHLAQDEVRSGWDYLKSHPTCFAQDEISSSWLSRADVIDQDDPSWTSLELDFF